MNSCTRYLVEQGRMIREQRGREAHFAARVGVSVPTLRLLIEASVKRPGLRWPAPANRDVVQKGGAQ